MDRSDCWADLTIANRKRNTASLSSFSSSPSQCQEMQSKSSAGKQKEGSPAGNTIAQILFQF